MIQRLFHCFQIDYLDKRKTVTGDYYSGLLDKIREKIVKNGRSSKSKAVLFLTNKVHET